MLRKIILVVASFALVYVAFLIYQSRDEDRFATVPEEVPRPPVRAVETQPAAAQPLIGDQKGTLIGGWQNVLPGGGSKIHVYDKTGEAKYIFEAAQWEPVSDTEYHMTKPSARVLLPDGQLAYVQADEGQVKVRQAEKQKLDPTSGWFKGHVRIVVDRTTPAWRRDHPDKADPEAHPETIDRIFLDDARFDLDLARLETDGPIRVESQRGSLEGQGFEMVWHEVTRRAKLARIRHGGRATVRGQELAQLGDISGDTELLQEVPDADPNHSQTGATTENEEVAPDTVTDSHGDEDDENQEISFLDPDNPVKQLRKDRIDTYQVVFRDNIVATQRQGEKVIGGLRGAQIVTLITDLGRQERAAVEFAPKDREIGSKRGQTGAKSPPATQPRHSNPAESRPAATQPRPPESTLELVWAGEVTVTPVEASETQPSTRPAGTTSPPAPPEKRTHLIAEGERIELQDSKQGTIVCRRLEVHNEKKQIWLTGSKQCPVVMTADADSQILVQDTLFFDRQAGIARITGPGKMIRREAQAIGPDTRPAPPSLEPGRLDDAAEFELTWHEGGQIDFDRAPVESPNTTAGEPPLTKQVVYLKHAAFRGNVGASLSNQSVDADEIDVVFFAPEPKLELRQKARLARADTSGAGSPIDATQARQVVATGNVRMNQRSDRAAQQKGERITDLVTCRRLEIEMGADDSGRNVPRVAKAFGRVSAEQTVQSFVGPIPVGAPQVRDIRADDQILIELASIPKMVTDAQRQRFEAYARQQGYTQDSPEWQRWEQRLRNRREIVLRKMTARGNVTARDERQDLNDLAGDSVEFGFDATGKISTAFVLGRPDRPAQIDHNTFFIRGRQVSLNMELQSVDVPGPGLLRFYSDQDLDGRALDRRIPIAVTWNKQMWLRGKDNAGTFSGTVRASSQNTLMESEQLQLRFSDAPREEAAARPATSVAQGLRASLWPRQQATRRKPLEERVKKKLAELDATGNAVVVSSSYEDLASRTSSVVATAFTSLLPAILKTPTSRPSASPDGRLLSRVRAAGPWIHIDLNEQQFVIKGEGNLLVEDYRLPKTGRSARPNGSKEPSTVLAPSSLPGVESMGPSQTLFTWASSFTFLNLKSIAVLGDQVVMRHAAGAEMALADQLESALKLDEATRKRITSRTASLTCGHLVIEFQRDRNAKAKSSASSLSSATTLKGFQARDNVFLMNREMDTQRSASGSVILYSAETNLAEINGTSLQQAVIEEVETRTGKLTGYWRGNTVKWNLKTRQIDAEGSNVNAPRGREDQPARTGLRQIR